MSAHHVAAGRTLGWNKDPAGHRYGSIHRLIAATGPLPKSWSNEATALPRILQDGAGACVAFAGFGGIYDSMSSRFAKDPSAPPPELFEPLTGYRFARAVDREPLADGSFPDLVDDGSAPNQFFRAAAEYGARRMSTEERAQIDAGSFDYARVNAEPTPEEIEAANANHVIGTAAITAVGADRITAIKAALVAGLGLCFAVYVDSKFMDYTVGVVGSPRGSILGGHYLRAFGYDTTLSGLTVVRFRNTWPDWGLNDNADALGDEQFVAGWEDIIVPKPQILTPLQVAA